MSKKGTVSSSGGFLSSLDGLWTSYVNTSELARVEPSRDRPLLWCSTELELTRLRATATPKLKLLDALQLFLMLTGIAQFVYCFAVTNYPFNAFLGGWVQLTTLLRALLKISR